IRSDNWPNEGSVNLSGPFVSNSGTNAQIWMADVSPAGVGIRRWNLNTNGVVSTNDLGITVVQAGANSDLDLYPYDVAVDSSNQIYTIQNRPIPPGDSSSRVFRFLPYQDGDPAETNADWKIGAQDDTMAGAVGIAVDPTATYVAVAFQGLTTIPTQFGPVPVFYATNGAPVAQPTPVDNPTHDYWDVAWDNVGNLYVVDNIASAWRVYSPPGKNRSTTAALATLTIGGGGGGQVAPILTNASCAGGQFSFLLLGQANVPYVTKATPNFPSWPPVATNTAATATRSITVNASSPASFFRARTGASGPVGPVLSAPLYTGGQFQFTLTGS